MRITVKNYALYNTIAKVPFLNRFFRIIGNQKKAIHTSILRKQQTIIRQGSPECFEDNSPLKIEWALTSYCHTVTIDAPIVSM